MWGLNRGRHQCNHGGGLAERPCKTWVGRRLGHTNAGCLKLHAGCHGWPGSLVHKCIRFGVASCGICPTLIVHMCSIPARSCMAYPTPAGPHGCSLCLQGMVMWELREWFWGAAIGWMHTRAGRGWPCGCTHCWATPPCLVAAWGDAAVSVYAVHLALSAVSS